MITGLRLVNFRGFQDATLTLKPLTVLLGPNSAGKSSFGHALYALNRIHQSRTGDPSLTTNDSDSPIDLGNYRTLLHQSDLPAVDDRISIGVKFGEATDAGEVIFGFGGRQFGDDLPLTRIGLTTTAAAQHVIGVADQHVPLIQVEQTSGPPLTTSKEHFAHIFERRNEKTWDAGALTSVILSFRGLEILSAILESTRSPVPFTSSVQDMLTFFLDRVSFLGPNRISPLRRYPAVPTKTMDARGEAMASLLLRNRDQRLRCIFSSQTLPTDMATARAEIQGGGGWYVEDTNLIQAVSRWMTHLGLSTGMHVDRDGDQIAVYLQPPMSRTLRAPTDIGFGISQVLPVLVSGLLLQEGELLIVEQPEAQLHPASQARLADFICSLAKAGRSVLIETHSEALFHRLRLRALMDSDLEAKTAVYFIDPPQQSGCCSTPRPIRLSEEGELEWPKRFLAEAIDEDIALTSVLRARRS